jgi:hypothetical protein
MRLSRVERTRIRPSKRRSRLSRSSALWRFSSSSTLSTANGASVFGPPPAAICTGRAMLRRTSSSGRDLLRAIRRRISLRRRSAAWVRPAAGA